jgi:hypothetical protein
LIQPPERLPSNFKLISASLGPDGITVVIEGEGDPPPIEQLVRIARAQTQKELSISLEIVPVKRQQVDLAAVEQQQ